MTSSGTSRTPGDRRRDQERESFDRKCAELKRRLENVTAYMTAIDRDALIIRMTRLRFKYQTRCAVPEFWRRDGA